MNGWINTTLGNVAKLRSGGTPSKDVPAFWGGTIPWVSAKDMKTFRLYDTEDHLSDEGLENGSRIVQPRTVLILSRGMTLLRDVPICVATRSMAFNQDVRAVVADSCVLSEFLAYSLLAHKDELLSMVDLAGHGTGRLNSDELKDLEILLPPLPEQRAIAHILGTLDDKIELNRRMNETLEGVASALFKSWFVDFDPVRAKAEGREPYGMDAETAALFPDSFEDSELGPIPSGWRVGKLGDMFDITMGQSPPGSTYNETGEGLPFFQGRADFGFRFPSNRVFCTAPTRFANADDTLVSVRAPVGDMNMAAERCAIGRGLAAVRHKTGHRSYTYYVIRSLSNLLAGFEAEGTVFGSINTKDFHNLRHLVPNESVMRAFERVAAPFDDQVAEYQHNVKTLSCSRDELLLRLIRGEIQIQDAEQMPTGATLCN